jgi:hypothetical protein
MRLSNWILGGALAILASACTLVSPYDQVIDIGIVDVSVQLNAFVKDMADAAGTPQGTYDANTRTYNALDAKLDILIARADAASNGQGCKIEKKFYDKISQIMADQMPAELKGAPETASGSADACSSRLLRMVKDQVGDIRKIHSTTDKCRDKSRTDNSQISCLRPATAGTALKIADQSINAVSVVEAAKRKLKE